MTNSGLNSSRSVLNPATYQLVGVSKLLLSGLRGILVCDGVGVGKTITAGYAASYFSGKGEGPTVVVCPVMLVDKWRSELQSKFGIDARPVRNLEELRTAEDEIPYSYPKMGPVAYIFAQSLLVNPDFSTSTRPGLLIVDEIHTYRNPETISYRVLHKLSAAAQWRMGLTATPINNTLDDLVTELSIILPENALPAVDATVRELWQMHRVGTLSPLLTRFEKEPLHIHFARRRIRTWLLAYPETYAARAVDVVRERRGRASRKGTRFDEITLYRLATSSPRAFEQATGSRGLLDPPHDPKLAALVRIRQEAPDSHLLVFCEFVGTVEYIREALGDGGTVLTLTGETPFVDRRGILETFKREPRAVLVMTAVGSEGLDLQFCSRMVNYDLHWNPMILEQRIGRIDRVGQDKTEVEVNNIIIAGSIDEHVLTTLSRKLSTISQSVFAPQPIVETVELAESRQAPGLIADELTVASEQAKGLDLIRALEESSRIRLEDYEIVGTIEPRFCNPELLRESASTGTLPWMSHASQSAWMEGVGRAARDFESILAEYA